MTTETKPITIFEVTRLKLAANTLSEQEVELGEAYEKLAAEAGAARQAAFQASARYEKEREEAELEAAYATHPDARPENLPKSELTKSQTKEFIATWLDNDRTYKLVADACYDDECGNGHNTFGLTAALSSQKKPGGWWHEEARGCLHEEIAKHIPHLAPYIKWHLCSSDGPMHYLANTTHWMGESKLIASTNIAEALKFLDNARSSAVWPEATGEDLAAPGLRDRLIARLPKLMADFQSAMQSLGFVY
jgi:hypothetical protein